MVPVMGACEMSASLMDPGVMRFFEVRSTGTPALRMNFEGTGVPLDLERMIALAMGVREMRAL